MDTPCKDCPYREVGCHDRCSTYLSFRAEKDKECEARLMKYKTYYYPSSDSTCFKTGTLLKTKDTKGEGEI